MSVHDFHDALDGFDQRQILHDGCSECEWRGESVLNALNHLDTWNFSEAWRRAADWERGVDVGRIATAEANLLRTLYAVQIQLERVGLPLGVLPTGATTP